jgi:hypothetical protein
MGVTFRFTFTLVGVGEASMGGVVSGSRKAIYGPLLYPVFLSPTTLLPLSYYCSTTLLPLFHCTHTKLSRLSHDISAWLEHHFSPCTS